MFHSMESLLAGDSDGSDTTNVGAINGDALRKWDAWIVNKFAINQSSPLHSQSDAGIWIG